MEVADLLGFQPLFCREGFITVLENFILVRHIRLVVALPQFGPRLALKRVHAVNRKLILTYRPGLALELLRQLLVIGIVLVILRVALLYRFHLLVEVIQLAHLVHGPGSLHVFTDLHLSVGLRHIRLVLPLAGPAFGDSRFPGLRATRFRFAAGLHVRTRSRSGSAALRAHLCFRFTAGTASPCTRIHFRFRSGAARFYIHLRFRFAAANLYVHLRFRLRSAAAYLLTKNRSLTLLFQFAHAFADRAHDCAFNRRLIGTFPRVAAIINIIIDLFVCAGKSVPGNPPAEALKFIRCHIQGGVYRRFQERFPLVFIKHHRVRHRLGIVGEGRIPVGKGLVARQHAVRVDRLVRHKFYLLDGHQLVVPLRSFLFIVRGFHQLVDLVPFQDVFLDELFDIIFAQGLVAMGVLIAHLFNIVPVVLRRAHPLQFFLQFHAEPGLLIVDRTLLFQPGGVLRRKALPFGLLPRVFLRTVRNNRLLVILIPLGSSQDILP